jgi:hypothetical protein
MKLGNICDAGGTNVKTSFNIRGMAKICNMDIIVNKS